MQRIASSTSAPMTKPSTGTLRNSRPIFPGSGCRVIWWMKPPISQAGSASAMIGTAVAASAASAAIQSAQTVTRGRETNRVSAARRPTAPAAITYQPYGRGPTCSAA